MDAAEIRPDATFSVLNPGFGGGEGSINRPQVWHSHDSLGFETVRLLVAHEWRQSIASHIDVSPDLPTALDTSSLDIFINQCSRFSYASGQLTKRTGFLQLS